MRHKDEGGSTADVRFGSKAITWSLRTHYALTLQIRFAAMSADVCFPNL
jgi:hypothetical protein